MKPEIFNPTEMKPRFELKVSKFPLRIQSELAQKSNEIWGARSNDSHLFDGKILSVLTWNSRVITCAPTSYRYFYAQAIEPDLRRLQPIRPLGVTGLILVGSGYLVARRSNLEVTQDAGLWEFAPSGTVEVGDELIETESTILNHLKHEAFEELGLGGNSLTQCANSLISEDKESGVIDIFIPLVTNLTFEDIRNIQVSLKNCEYEEVALLENLQIQRDGHHISADSALSLSSKKILKFLSL